MRLHDAGPLGVTAAALISFAAWGCSSRATPPEPPPPAGLISLDEKGWARLRQQHQGRVLLVNFWATWGEPSREEFPAVVRLHREYCGRGLPVVAISMDEPESVADIEKFLSWKIKLKSTA